MFNYLVWIALLVVAGILAIRFNRKRKPTLQRAHHAAAQVANQAGPTLEQFSHLLDRVQQVIGTRQQLTADGFSGATLDQGQLVLDQVETLKRMSADLQAVMADADSLLFPVGPLAQAANMVNSSRYLHCLNLLEGTPLAIPRLPGHDQDPPSDQVTIPMFFQHFHNYQKVADSNLTQYESVLADSQSKLQPAQQQLEQLQQLDVAISHQEYRSDRQRSLLRFATSTIAEKLIPEFERDIETCLQGLQRDPFDAQKKSIPELQRRLGGVLTIAQVVDDLQKTRLDQLHELEQQLVAAHRSTRWVQRQLRTLADKIGQLLKQAAAEDVSLEAEQIRREVSDLNSKLVRLVEIQDQLDSQFEPAIETMKQEVEQARERVAKQLEISDSQSLRESDYSPDDELQRAHRQLLSAQSAIDKGNLDLAQLAVSEIEVELDQADRIVSDSLAALEAFPGSQQTVEAQLNKITGDLQSLGQQVEHLSEQFERCSLVVTALGFEPLTGDGDEQTLAGELDLLEDWKRQLDRQFQESIRDYKTARILEGCNRLDLLQLDLELLAKELVEFAELCQRPQQWETDNRAHLTRLQKELTEIDSLARQAEDAQLTNRSEAWKQAVIDFAEQQRPTGKRMDPVSDRKIIDQLDEQLETLKADFLLGSVAYQEFQSAQEAAKAELRVTDALVHNSHNDNIPDSQQLKSDQQVADRLRDQLASVEARLQSGDRDWQRLEEEMSRVHIDLATLNARLRGELESARQAIEVLDQATSKHLQCTQWRGDFNIVVVGRPGAAELDRARTALAAGDYLTVLHYARDAMRKSEHGLAAAKAQVARFRRQRLRENRRRSSIDTWLRDQLEK